nr:MAG TPA: hypothetical protein [Caudoviricetes sp.]
MCIALSCRAYYNIAPFFCQYSKIKFRIFYSNFSIDG